MYSNPIISPSSTIPTEQTKNDNSHSTSIQLDYNNINVNLNVQSTLADNTICTIVSNPTNVKQCIQYSKTQLRNFKKNRLRVLRAKETKDIYNHNLSMIHLWCLRTFLQWPTLVCLHLVLNLNIEVLCNRLLYTS